MGGQDQVVPQQRAYCQAMVQRASDQSPNLLPLAEAALRYGQESAGGRVCGCDTGTTVVRRRCCRDRSDRWDGSGDPQWRRCGYCGSGAADPEVMLTDFTGADRVIIACGRTDLRLGIDGLAALVKKQFRLDPFTNTLFLFCGKRKDRIKALYWEGNGFVLLYKRLESGSFQWPRNESEARSLTPQQYRWLMEGLSVDQPKAHKPVSGLEIV